MIEHLSYSSISTYLSCGWYWKMKYIDKKPTTTSPELVFGSAFHNTVENFLLPQNTEQQSLLTLWQQKWTEQIGKDEINWGIEHTPESYFNEGVRMLGNKDIQEGIAVIKAKEIECKVELRVPAVPVPIVGYIDVITQDGVPGDFKTSKASWSNDKALGEMQPLFYLAALNQAGVSVPGWTFRHYIFVKTKTPQFQMIEHVHKPSQLMWLFNMIQSVWKGIEAEIFPMNPTGWKCSPNYCEYWGDCRGKYE